MSEGRTSGAIVAIQCPSCKTRFGVDSQVLGQVARPRFHCSKCDTTFSQSLASIMTAVDRARGAGGRRAERGGVADSRGRDSREGYAGPPAGASSPELSNSPLLAARTSMIRPEPELLGGQSDGRDPLFDSSQPSFPHTSHSVSEATIMVPPHSVRESSAERIPDGGRSAEKPRDVWADSASNRDNPQREDIPPSPSESASCEDRSPPRSADFSERSELVEATGTTISSSRSSTRRFAARATLIAAAPVVIVQLILVGLTAAVVRTPQRIGKGEQGGLLAPIFASPLKMPPPEVRVEEVTFRKVDLESGESLYVVEGRVKNGTASTTLSQIQVQALTFDDRGFPLQKGVALAGSLFSSARFVSFSAKKNLEMQEGSLKGKAPIVAGGSNNFRVLLPLDSNILSNQKDRSSANGNPAFFSARVYAVSKGSSGPSR
mgnify:FL=1